MNLEVNIGDGSITSRRMAWAKQPRLVVTAHRLCRAARRRGFPCSGYGTNSGAVIILPTRSVSIYGMDGGMIQNILPYRPYPSDPQWENSMHQRQHARYLALAAFARQCGATNAARYWIQAAARERSACH